MLLPLRAARHRSQHAVGAVEVDRRLLRLQVVEEAVEDQLQQLGQGEGAAERCTSLSSRSRSV